MSRHTLPVVDGGIHFPGTAVWLDPLRPKGVSLLSSSRFLAPRFYTRAICSELTAELIRARSTRRRAFHPLVIPHGQTVSLGNLSVTLYPSGTKPDGNLVLVEEDGIRTLYWRGVPSLSAPIERLQTLSIDRCVFEASTTPHSTPTSPAWMDQLMETLESGQGVLLQSAPIGPAQELAEELQSRGARVFFHPSYRGVNQVLENHGLSVPHEGYASAPQAGQVVLCMTLSRKGRETPRIQRLRAHSPIGRESLPDFHPDPVVEWVPHEPFEKLWTVFEELKISSALPFGYRASEVANELNSRGIHAQAVAGSTQLKLEI